MLTEEACWGRQGPAGTKQERPTRHREVFSGTSVASGLMSSCLVSAGAARVPPQLVDFSCGFRLEVGGAVRLTPWGPQPKGSRKRYIGLGPLLHLLLTQECRI